MHGGLPSRLINTATDRPFPARWLLYEISLLFDSGCLSKQRIPGVSDLMAMIIVMILISQDMLVDVDEVVESM